MLVSHMFGFPNVFAYVPFGIDKHTYIFLGINSIKFGVVIYRVGHKYSKKIKDSYFLKK